MTQNWLKRHNAFYSLPYKPWQNFGITIKMSQIIFHLVMNFDAVTVMKDSLYGIPFEDHE